jgi:hypothetical protein
MTLAAEVTYDVDKRLGRLDRKELAENGSLAALRQPSACGRSLAHFPFPL